MKTNTAIRFWFDSKPIRDGGAFVCLTDMWRAAGASDSKRPAEWLRSKQAHEFGAFLAEHLAMGKSHSDLVRTEAGGSGGSGSTWAHWQLALAYAKYLSPAFHAWANDVVRKVMAGESVSVPNAEERVIGLIAQLFAPFQAQTAALVAQVSALATQVATLASRPSATIDSREAKSLAGRIKRAAARKARLDGVKFRSCWQKLRSDILGLVGHVGSRCRYDNMPPDAFRVAVQRIEQVEAELDAREAPRPDPTRQLSLIKTG